MSYKSILRVIFFYIFFSSTLIYIWMSFFGIQSWGMLIMLALPFVAIYFNKNELISKGARWKINYEFIFVVLLILAEALVILFVLFPMVWIKTHNGFSFVQFTGINDFYKHVYTLTALLANGLPAIHPFYTPANFSYYYGYYLLPAGIAQSFNLPYNYVMWIYPAITIIITLAFLYYITKSYIKKLRYRLLALIIIILGTGLDIIPTTKLNNPAIRHIESWSQELELGLIVNNTFMSFLWVPQHVLASISLIYICSTLISPKQTILEKISIPLGFMFIALTSMFVAITAIIWIGIIFLIRKHSRKDIFLHALVAGILAIPYIMQLRDRNNLFYFYSPKFFTYIQNSDWLNRLINIIVEYGPITIIAIILTWIVLKPLKTRIAVLIGVLAPILITWFIRTPGPNDFGMRSVLPAQLIIPIMLCYSLDKIKSKKATALIFIIVCFNLIVSGYGFIFEHYNSWKDRKILTVQDSHFLLWTKSLSKNIKLASYQKEDWSFYIPSIGFKTNLTPHLYDSGVYISGDDGLSHAQYEILAKEIFDNRATAKEISLLITQKESQWRNLNKYFSWHPFDYFVITQKEWVKKGINPWYFIFKQMDIPINEIGHDFVYFKYEDLVNITNKKTPKIAQDKIQKLTVADNQFLLTEGLWYIVACKDISRERIVVSLSDYFALIDHKFPGKGCAGNTLVAIDNDPIKLDNGFSFDSLYAIPVFIDNI